MPAFDIEALLDPEGAELSSPEKRAALAASLRRQQAVGTVGQLMGVEPTVRAGAAMQDNAGNILRQALAKQQQMRETKQRGDERTQAQNNWQRSFDQQATQHAATEQRLREQGGAGKAITPYQQAQLDAAARAHTDSRLSQYSQRLQTSGLPGLLTSVGEANKLLAKYPVGKNIPGIGPVENALPMMVMSDEAQIVRSTVQGVANQLLKLRSGSAVTDPEMRRFLNEVATGAGVPEAVFRVRWPQVMQIIQAEKANVDQGFEPEVIATYEGRSQQPAGNQQPQIPDSIARPPARVNGAPQDSERPGDKYLGGAQ